MPARSDSPPSSPDSMTSESSISAFSEPSYSWMPNLVSVPHPDAFDIIQQKYASSSVGGEKSQKFELVKSLSPARLEHQRARELPTEVLDCILNHLQSSHCPDEAAFRHDLRCLALTSRYWSEAVAPRLYATIHFHLADLHSQRKWYGSRSKTRLRSVQKLLQTRSQHVRTIIVPDGQILSAPSSRATTDLADILASLVDQCPNLQRLVGVSAPYNHERTRLSEALSRKEHLQEHIWTIDRAAKSWKSKHSKTCSLSPDHVETFASAHSNWSRLQTLVLRGTPEANMSNGQLFFDTLTQLPSLHQLCLSHFNAHDFNDTHLPSLQRPLESLRLESLPGLTEGGLTSFLGQTKPLELRSLSLLDLNIHGLAFITSLFASLPSLLRLALRTAHIDLDTPSAPILSHANLTHLHWDLASREKAQQPLAANAILASYITENAFPALRHLHCPNDPAGLLQSVCRPLRPLRADQIPREEVNGVALAAYSRAAQALGSGGCGGWGADVAKGGQGVVRFVVWDEDLHAQTRSLEVPRCLGRVEGVRVPNYVLTSWVKSVDEVLGDAARGLRALF